MIKFGLYPEKTVPELGAEAALEAIKDAGINIKDIEMFASGNLYQSNAMIGQRILQQIGQTGIPVINVANACATDSTAFPEAYMAVGAGMYGVAMAGGRRAEGQAGTARRWRRRVGPGVRDRGTNRLGPDARRIRPGWHGAYAQVRDQARALREDFREVAQACDQESILAVSQRSYARRRDERPHGGVSEHALYVLPDGRRRRVRDSRQRGQAEAARGRAQARQGGGVGAHLRPVYGTRSDAARCQHADAARGQEGLRDGGG